MKNISKIAVLALSVVMVSPVSFAQEAASSSSAEAVHTKDGGILGWLNAVDNNEIAAGKLAKEKSKNHKVVKFADMMIKQHGDHLKSTESLSKKIHAPVVETSEAKALKTEGKEAASDLKSKDGASFDEAYMQAMVDGHKAALKGLDDHLSNVVNKDLKAYLEKTQTVVKKHLKAAEKTQHALKSKS